MRPNIYIGGAALLVVVTGVSAQSNVDDTQKFAWCENVGWTNWRDANGAINGTIVVGDFLSGYVWGENAGWINLGDGTPANGMNYANTVGNDFGVNIDANDDLFGLAWGENIGWINFDTRSKAPNQARFDFSDLRFRGFAWGENVGWINLDDSTRFVGVSSPDPPSDGDDTCQTVSADTGMPCNTDADCTPPAVCGLKSRYVSIQPGTVVGAGGATTIQVEIVDMPLFPGRVGELWWAGAEVSVPNMPGPALRGALLECTMTPFAQDWSGGVVHLFGPSILPGSAYRVRTCDDSGLFCSDPHVVQTGKWGDVVRPFGGVSQPAFGDINEIVFKFRNLGSAPDMPRVDLVGTGNPGNPNTPNQSANFGDISACVEGFRGIGYAYTVPACP